MEDLTGEREREAAKPNAREAGHMEATAQHVAANPLSLIDVKPQRSLKGTSKNHSEINNKITYHSKKEARDQQCRREVGNFGTAAYYAIKQVKCEKTGACLAADACSRMSPYQPREPGQKHSIINLQGKTHLSLATSNRRAGHKDTYLCRAQR